MSGSAATAAVPAAALEDVVAPFGVVAIVGLAKNAGKTTVLNHLLTRLDGPLALASLGLDGERRDQLTGRPKPRVRPPAGTLVLSARELVDGAEVIAALPYRTAVGEVVLVRARGDEDLAVSGPTRLAELREVVKRLRGQGARVVLEGALGRLGAAAEIGAEAVVVAAGAAAAEGVDELERRLRQALDALDLPVAHPAAGLVAERGAGWEAETAAAIAAAGSAAVALPGALTGPLLEQLIRDGTRTTLVVADATRVLARPQQVARARRRGIAVVARRRLPIVAVTASPFHPDRRHTSEDAFAAAVRASAGRWPVFDVVAGLAA